MIQTHHSRGMDDEDSMRVSSVDDRLFLDLSDDDEEKQLEKEDVELDTGDKGDTDAMELEPQWPQSYRRSMDLYSHMASPSLSFLTSSEATLPYASFRMSAPSFPRPVESTASLLEPLLISQKTEQQHQLKDIESGIVEVEVAPESFPKLPAPKKVTDCHISLPENGCTFLQATLNGVNVLAGVGVLSTPYALSQGGWIGVLLLIFFAVACCYTGILLRRCLDSAPGLVTYPDIGQAAFGRFGRLLISVILYTELYTCCVEFLILEGDNLGTIFSSPTIHGLDSHKVFACIAALIILPTVWLRDLSLLSYISAGGVLTSVIVVVSVWWVGAVDGVGFHHTGNFVNVSKLPVAVGLFGFCFSGHAVFPNIYSSMKNRAHFNKVLQVCFILCILMYGGMAVMGFKMFGSETTSQVTLNLPNHFLASKLAIWTTVITPLTKYALTITPVAMSVEELLPHEFVSKNHWVSIVIRTLIVASTLGVALLIPFFGFVMAFIGSFLSLTGSLILPCACFLSIQRKQVTVWQAVLCVVTIAVGVFAAFVGTYSSISGIIGQLRH